MCVNSSCCFPPQNDLKVLFTSLADSKYVILQKLADVLEQPVAEQIEVFAAAFFREEQRHRVDLIYYDISNVL